MKFFDLISDFEYFKEVMDSESKEIMDLLDSISSLSSILDNKILLDYDLSMEFVEFRSEISILSEKEIKIRFGKARNKKTRTS